MKKVMLITTVVSVVIMGCSKEEPIEMPEPAPCNNHQTAEHMPLSVGNYWVYDVYRTDTLGSTSIMSSSDSAYVDRDTTINGNTYYIIEGDVYATLTTGEIIRNENNSILYFDTSSNTEKILFSTSNIETVYNTQNIGNNMFQLSNWTNPGQHNITVDAGSFDCHQRETEVLPLITNYPWGTRTQLRYYNDDVGVISNQFHFASSSEVFDTELVSYNVN